MLKYTRSNPARADFNWSEVKKNKLDENGLFLTFLHEIAPILYTLHSLVGLTLVNQTLFFFGRLKSTLPVGVNYKMGKL